MAKAFEVRFEQTAQTATEGRFTIPKAIIDLLGVTESHDLIVEVSSHKGTKSKITSIKSGTEIYGCFSGHFEPGELLTVRVTRLDPPG